MAASRFAAVLVFVLTALLSAQEKSTGQLVVTIRDASGAVVPGARIGIVRLPNTDTAEIGWLQSALHSPEQLSTNADSRGEAVVSLANGRYAIIVAATGFKRYFRKVEVGDESNPSVAMVLVINPENIRVDCMGCSGPVIPLEPIVLNAFIPLEPIQTITLKPARKRRR